MIGWCQMSRSSPINRLTAHDHLHSGSNRPCIVVTGRPGQRGDVSARLWRSYMRSKRGLADLKGRGHVNAPAGKSCPTSRPSSCSVHGDAVCRCVPSGSVDAMVVVKRREGSGARYFVIILLMHVMLHDLNIPGLPVGMAEL